LTSMQNRHTRYKLIKQYNNKKRRYAGGENKSAGEGGKQQE